MVIAAGRTKGRIVLMDKDYYIKIQENFGDDDEYNTDTDGDINGGSEDGHIHRRNGDYRNHRRHSEHNKKTSDRRKGKKKRGGFFKGLGIILLVFIIVIAAVVVCVKPPEKTVFLIAGTDKGGTRTDTIMLGVYDSRINGGITLMSIPRDTLVSVSDDTYARMREEYPQPSGKGMKINEIYHFASEGDGMNLLIDEVERMFDVSIDYYAKIDFDAFKYIIDGIGGVKFSVERDMDYEDPYQDLKIHLKAGEQILDGEKAEQLLRFRSGYARADLERVEVQQRFMSAFISQAASVKNIAKNFGVYKKALNEYVDTNVKMNNLVKYARCVFTIGKSETVTATMPGQTGVKFGRNGFLADTEKFESEYGSKYYK